MGRPRITLDRQVEIRKRLEAGQGITSIARSMRWSGYAIKRGTGGAIVSSEYPGANYDVEELKRVASELRAQSLSAPAIAEELNQQGFTGRLGGPLYAANIASLVGPRSLQIRLPAALRA